MCGILGTTFRYKPNIIKYKLDLIRFRGPDHTGIKYIQTPNTDIVTLGHVRLSIIDLDARSNQPFIYNDDISIVFNGEVYNYKELRTRFLGGARLRTESDTEVICAMYEKFGIESVKYLNGMFAYAIYDRKRNIIVGARDRLGKKPFYYYHSDRGFEFASQIKSILYGNNFHIDSLSRKFYILHGYIPDPYCIFREVKKLRAGQYFTYSLESNKLEIKQYWNIFDNSCGFSRPKTYNEAKETVKELIFDSVRIRLNANVPIGMFLSGGIDSSLICAIVSKYNKDLCAYTIGFNNVNKDESPYAAAVAKYLGIPIKISLCDGAEQQNIFNDYIDFFDEPFCDPSMIPSCLVAQKARENVTVVLGGDGGDELFYGYEKYLYIKERLRQYKKPYWIRKLASPYFLLKNGWHDMIFATQHDYEDVFRSEGIFCYSFNGAERFSRLRLARLIPDRELMRKERGILAYTDYDIKFFMNAVNQKVDRATMRSSLELRNPIMDYRVAEYSRLLPYEYMYSKERGLKNILKDILYGMVPRELLDRPKQGFMPPTSDWFHSSLKNSLLDTVTYDRIKKLLPELNAGKCIKLRDHFIKGENMDARMFWALYTYIKWHDNYIRK